MSNVDVMQTAVPHFAVGILVQHARLSRIRLVLAKHELLVKQLDELRSATRRPHATHKPTSGSSGASQITLRSESFSRKGKLSWSGCPDRYRLSSTMPKFGGGTSIVEVVATRPAVRLWKYCHFFN